MVEPSAPASELVIRTVAEASDADVSELPPLYGYVDPDALDDLIDRMTDGEVTFAYGEFEVTVDSDGDVSLDARVARGSSAGTALGRG